MKKKILYGFLSLLIAVAMVGLSIQTVPRLSAAIEATFLPPRPVHMPSGGIGHYIPGGRNIEAYGYVHSSGYPPFPDRAKFLGTLTGSWYEMGKKFGARSGDLARCVSDIWWKEQCDKYGRAETLKAMDLYEAQIFALDPRQIDFMRGIVDGAAAWLNQSSYANPGDPLYSSNYQRVLAVNIYDEWAMRHPGKFPDGTSTYGGSVPQPPPDQLCVVNDFSICSGFSARGAATMDGEIIAAQNRQAGYNPRAYETVYIINPPRGNTCWVLTNCPQVAANQVVNNKGLSVKLFAGGATNKMSLEYPGGPYCAEGFGVSWFNLLLYVGTHADTAEEAVEILTRGTHEYRARTGRNSLLRGGGWLFMVTDKDTMAVVETTADRYAVRYAGETFPFTGPNWNNPNYIVCTNNSLCDFSYDKNNNLTNVPLSIFGDGYARDSAGNITGLDGRGIRFWTMMWDMEHNYGRIDRYRAQQIMAGLYAYDKDTGEKIDCAQDAGGNWRTWGKLKPCNVGSSRWSLSAGSNDGKIAVLDGKNSEVHWTMGSPNDWQGAWDAYYFKMGLSK